MEKRKILKGVNVLVRKGGERKRGAKKREEGQKR